jgi:5-methylcytosine-specific restriction endonuclease McrA
VSHGPHIPDWSGRRRAEALARVKAEGKRTGAPCCICHQGIDYELEYPHPQSCSVQHLQSRKAFPHLTWDPANWAPAHLDCNKSAGAQQPIDLGVMSEEW